MRASGILLPISSIPSPHGIGCFDRNAYRFVDTLVSCGQKYWQILPMGPTGYGDSPYHHFRHLPEIRTIFRLTRWRKRGF